MKRLAALAILLWFALPCLAQWKTEGTLEAPPNRSAKLYEGNAKQDIAKALKTAAKQRKRVLLVFGGDWCYDCHVLEYNFHKDPALRGLLEANYKVVNVDVGKYDKNLDVAAKYKMNLSKGVPALAVLESDGKLLYSDPGGFFEHARGMTKKEVADFLEKWAPARKS